VVVPGRALNLSKGFLPRSHRARLLLARIGQARGRGFVCTEMLAMAKAKAKVKLVCEQCGAKFEVKPSYAKRARFCSVACYGKWQSANNVAEAGRNWQGGPATVKCAQCGRSFQLAPSCITGINCCSRKCKGQWQSEHIVGDRHPNWAGGIGQVHYGITWDAQQAAALERDNHTCRICGLTSEEVGREIDVHHIIPFREWDDSKEANALDNLVCLCRSCHLRLEWGKLCLADYIPQEVLNRAGQLTMADMLL